MKIDKGGYPVNIVEPTHAMEKANKQVDVVVESITENMLAGVVEAKYESLKDEISEIVDEYTGWRIMEVVKKYFPPDVEYAQQLTDLKEAK